MGRVILVVLAGVVIVAGCTGPVGEQPQQDPQGSTAETPPDGELEIHHIDVGQADATLLIGPSGETMLIDTGGYRADGQTVLTYLDNHGIDRIDHLVTTHPHADHIGGHERIINEYETNRSGIGAIYDPGATHTTVTYEEYLDAVERHNVDLFEVKQGDKIPIDGPVGATVLHPPENATATELNDASLALLIEFGEVSYLTTGDGEAVVESRLVEKYGDELDAEIYQAGHHGSSTSSTEQFIEQVDPNISVISSAGDSQFSHPHDKTLKRFDSHGIKTYWTGAHGTVVITTDGRRMRVSTEIDRPTDAGELLELKPIETVAPQLDRVASEPAMNTPALP